MTLHKISAYIVLVQPKRLREQGLLAQCARHCLSEAFPPNSVRCILPLRLYTMRGVSSRSTLSCLETEKAFSVCRVHGGTLLTEWPELSAISLRFEKTKGTVRDFGLNNVFCMFLEFFRNTFSNERGARDTSLPLLPVQDLPLFSSRL